jgi:hypothetical protein
MRKGILFTGIGIFLLGIMCFFLSGATNGPTSETATPTVPFLYGTNQFLWLLLTFAGIVNIAVGVFLKKK